MHRSSTLTIVLIGVLFAGVFGRNEKCDRNNDCPDAGTMCNNRRCVCWTEISPGAADAWSCDDDQKCEKNFPGHACRPSADCSATMNRMGYCQPRNF